MIKPYEFKCTKCGKISIINVDYIVDNDFSNKNYIKNRLNQNYLIRQCNCECLEKDALDFYKKLPYSISQPR